MIKTVSIHTINDIAERLYDADITTYKLNYQIEGYLFERDANVTDRRFRRFSCPIASTVLMEDPNYETTTHNAFRLCPNCDTVSNGSDGDKNEMEKRYIENNSTISERYISERKPD